MKEFGGSFAKDYMNVAREVEAKVDAEHSERIKNGLTANKECHLIRFCVIIVYYYV